MKPLIQKLPLNEDFSFVAKTFRTPHFEVGWHQHIEYELILFTEGSGISFIGNYVGEFETGDIYLLGSNLPHTFQKSGEQITSAVVVQFRDDFWGNHFLEMPESRPLKKLLQASLHGLQITGQTKSVLANHIQKLENASGFKRVLLLEECLYLLAESNDYSEVSTQEITSLTPKDKQGIDRVFQFTIDSFNNPVSLPEVAAVACMSVPAFCRYFKRSTKKTYTQFLNEVRIGYACNLLQDTQKTVLDICYESGYNSIANFHRQFFKIKSYTPLQYRKYFMAAQHH
jgi:AraC-like DNA-binding protein